MAPPHSGGAFAIGQSRQARAAKPGRPRRWFAGAPTAEALVARSPLSRAGWRRRIQAAQHVDVKLQQRHDLIGGTTPETAFGGDAEFSDEFLGRVYAVHCTGHSVAEVQQAQI